MLEDAHQTNEGKAKNVQTISRIGVETCPWPGCGTRTLVNSG